MHCSVPYKVTLGESRKKFRGEIDKYLGDETSGYSVHSHYEVLKKTQTQPHGQNQSNQSFRVEEHVLQMYSKNSEYQQNSTEAKNCINSCYPDRPFCLCISLNIFHSLLSNARAPEFGFDEESHPGV